MFKHIYFTGWEGDFWPNPDELRPYFLERSGARWIEGGNDSWAIYVRGLEGTESLPFGRGRKDIVLRMWGAPDLGVLLVYHKMGPSEFRDAWTSKGDLSRLRKFIESRHGTPLPVGLFIPFDKAWLAVKEFMETEGALPKCIEWVRNADLPENTFPDPGMPSPT